MSMVNPIGSAAPPHNDHEREEHTMKKITTYIESGRTFHIFRDQHGYWGFDERDFDQHGMLTVKHNGISGHLKSSLKDCIESISIQIKLDELLLQGHSLQEAAQILFGIPA
jgi:hypothetical protein